VPSWRPVTLTTDRVHPDEVPTVTEPIDEPGIAAAGPEATPTPDSHPTPEPASATATGWVAPEGGGSGGGRRRGCVIAAVVVGAFLILGYLGLVFLGNQARSLLAGTMEFGSGGSGCSVSGKATTFPTSGSIHAVAYLERAMSAGETLTVAVTYPDATTETNDQAIESVADCVTEDIRPGLSPGHYVLVYRVGTEVLANGSFDITP
jgi:hypothetical protein